MTRLIVPLGLMVVTLFACGPSQPDPKLKAAYQFHLEALAISDSLDSYLDDGVGEKWDSLRQAHQEWETLLVEVPGFEHAHDHDHDHSHHHDNPVSDLPPAEMQQLQQALRDEVGNMLQQAHQWAQENMSPDSLSR